MENKEIEQIIEAILFAAGRVVTEQELMIALEISKEKIEEIVNDMLVGIDLTNYEVCLDRKKAIHLGMDLLRENDFLLILGKGHEEFIIFKDKKIPFNDKNEVLNYIDYKKQNA